MRGCRSGSWRGATGFTAERCVRRFSRRSRRRSGRRRVAQRRSWARICRRSTAGWRPSSTSSTSLVAQRPPSARRVTKCPLCRGDFSCHRRQRTARFLRYLERYVERVGDVIDVIDLSSVSSPAACGTVSLRRCRGVTRRREGELDRSIPISRQAAGVAGIEAAAYAGLASRPVRNREVLVVER